MLRVELSLAIGSLRVSRVLEAHTCQKGLPSLTRAGTGRGRVGWGGGVVVGGEGGEWGGLHVSPRRQTLMLPQGITLTLTRSQPPFAYLPRACNVDLFAFADLL